jgi:hypothetical protein
MIQNIPGGSEPLNRIALTRSPAEPQGPTNFAPAESEPEAPDQTSFDDGGTQPLFPRNSWQSSDAQISSVIRANERLNQPYNYRQSPGTSLLGGGGVSEGPHIPNVSAVYGMPAMPVNQGPFEPIGPQGPVETPKGPNVSAVYGMPAMPVNQGPFEPIRPQGPVETPKGPNVSAVYGMPNFPREHTELDQQ